MTLQALKRKIEKAGHETRETRIRTKDGIEKEAFFVIHDYDGLYPSSEALNTCDYAIFTAKKAGFHAEPRGYKTATLIY